MKKIAIIGSGISGLGCAYALRDKVQLTVFEAGSRLGGHANTVDVDLEGIRFGVDTGFLVYNEKTYPHLIRLFDELKVKVTASEMSFSVSRRDIDKEWCGSSLSSLFAQPANALSPRFWSMIRDILRFNKAATQFALGSGLRNRATLSATSGTATCVTDNVESASLGEPIGHYLKRNSYGKAFSEDYLLPMAAAIWSCPTSTMASFPIGSFVRFFHNHGLLQIANRPQWFTCEGGSRQYVQAIAKELNRANHRIRTNTEVTKVSRLNGSVDITTITGKESFDGVVFACHSDQALKVLTLPTEGEQETLSSISYQDNTAYLHRDINLMPKRRKAWAAWNYLCDKSPEQSADQQVSVTYWLNRLQPLPFKTNLFVSLNPIVPPRRETLIQTVAYAHPVFDARAMLAQKSVPSLQGKQNTWFAGAWCGYGFHEDGLKSGLDAAAKIEAQMGSAIHLSTHQELAA